MPTVCPGYTTKLPKVTEAIRAWVWWDKGQLSTRWPEPSDNLCDLIELFHGYRGMAERYEMQERQRRAKQ